jgi:hypothetical protein
VLSKLLAVLLGPALVPEPHFSTLACGVPKAWASGLTGPPLMNVCYMVCCVETAPADLLWNPSLPEPVYFKPELPKLLGVPRKFPYLVFTY